MSASATGIVSYQYIGEITVSYYNLGFPIVNQLLEIFENCVARINIHGVPDQGTGFFVAPGLLLTCAHVIKECFDSAGKRIRNRVIKISWKREIYEEIEIKEHWLNSYPDLALLVVPVKEHPCVLIQDSFQPTDRLYCYGYPYNEKEIRAEGMQPDAEGPRNVERAEETEEYIKFKAAQTVPGFSGGPLLNLSKGVVCGIVKASRNTDSDLGGVAIRSRVILKHLPFLVEAQKLYHDKNNVWTSTLANCDENRSFQESLSIDKLHSLTKKHIVEQIKAVGQDKYLSEIYTKRETEEDIKGFIQFDKLFRKRASSIIDQLNRISREYNLEGYRAIHNSGIKLRISTAKSTGELHSISSDIKKAFYYNQTNEAIELIISAIRANSPSQHAFFIKDIKLKLGDLIFINKADLINIEEGLSELYRRGLAGGSPFDSKEYDELLQVFPSESIAQVGQAKSLKRILASDSIKEFDLLIERGSKRCLALVGKAGTGKTNTICQLAEKAVEDQPTILLSGQMEISTEYDIDFHIQRRFEAELNGPFFDWMDRINPILENEGKWLLIFIDGINESNNLQLFVKLLKNLLPRIEDKRIKLIVSCRDLFWELFSRHLKSYLFGDSALLLSEFTEVEWLQVIPIYFKKFEIECEINEEAKLTLKNPLLLRFFCEAYRGEQLDKVQDLRLLPIFNLYVKRISENISERLGLLQPDTIEDFLVKAAFEMWANKSVTVGLSDIGVTPQDMSELTSIYNSIRSENVIFEESINSYSRKKTIRFLYDEFMEYMLARSWIDNIYGSSNPDNALTSLTNEAIESIITFQPTFGAILFLDKMLDRKGSLITTAIKQLISAEKSFVESRQMLILYAFESIPFERIEDEVILSLEEFERLANSDVKDRLASIILGVLKERPDHPKVKALVSRVLEIDISREKQSREAGAGNVAESQISLYSKPTHDREIALLPPGRYHYPEETKLNAISILVASKDAANYEMIEKGIMNLGQLDLHNSLQALASLDFADEKLVYKNVAEHIKLDLPEYHIYCAWLLRSRYGKTPSQFLIQLLLSEETRVHQYAYNLFETRFIESELLSQILKKLRQQNKIKPWHLFNLVRLLQKRSQFYDTNLVSKYGQKIVTALEHLYNHPSTTLRLEAYRSAVQYPEFSDAFALLTKLQQDEDIYIRAFARKAINEL